MRKIGLGVSQLDQINAYMLLLAPLLEDEQVACDWQRDLVLLARVVKDRFFAPEHGMFWGTLHDPASRKLGSRHSDFGHSMKSLWMLYLTGQLTGQRDLVELARPLIACRPWATANAGKAHRLASLPAGFLGTERS